MLNDDISKGISGVVNSTGRVVASTIRGALMFGALAVAGAAIISVAPLVWSALTTYGIGSGIGALSNFFTHTTLAYAAGFFTTGAAIGAVTFGVTSLIPGISEGFGLKKLFAKKQDSSPSASAEPVIQAGTVPTRAPEPVLEMENPDAKTNHVASLQARRASQMQQQGELIGAGK